MTAPAPPPAPIALTLGDPCGVGPELVVRAFDDPLAAGCVVYGDVQVLRRAGRALGRWPVMARIDAPADAAGLPRGVIPVVEPPAPPGAPELASLPIGAPHAAAGAAAARWVEHAVRAVQRGEAAAVVTAPIHKAAWSMAGVAFPGHTEMLQALAAVPGEAAPPVRMMLESPELRVVLVTIHLSLRRAIDAVTRESVLQTLRIADAAGRRLGWAGRRLAVAGLNPHAGEDGLFGDEEIRVIAPAIEQARREGIDAHGPYPPDTVFMRARRLPGQPAAFDAVVAMTHDHGLIPVKYLGVEHGVNVTLGLPFVRTSPDHGTAFDIAGTGRADPRSFLRALAVARQAVAGPAQGPRAAGIQAVARD